MGQQEENVQYLIDKIDTREEFITLDDGFIYYMPEPGGGALNAWALRAIADELDKRNENWNLKIEQYFEQLDAT